MTEMNALVLTRAGGPAALKRAVVPRPVPGRGQVLVRVEACGLNPVDVGLSRGGHPAWQWPHVPGLDAAGTVYDVGPGVQGLAEGQRVAFHGDLRVDGALAQFVIADHRAVALVPDGVTAISAAALPCAGMTAFQAVVRRLRVAPGQTVLVTGGNGGVGGFAIQLAKIAGARVIATASRDLDRPRSLGADDVVDYAAEDALESIRAAAGDLGVDAIVDTVGEASATTHLPLLTHAGGIACVAGRADLSVVRPFTIAPSLHEIALGAAYSAGADRHVRDLGIMLSDLLRLVDEGRLDAMASRVISIDEVAGAFDEIRGRHVTGKIVVIVE